MLKRVHFPASALPYLLVSPQILITLVFFIWPASQAVYQSFLIEDAFGLSTEFVWFENFQILAQDSHYLSSFWRTMVFSAAVALLSMSAWRHTRIWSMTFSKTLTTFGSNCEPELSRR